MTKTSSYTTSEIVTVLVGEEQRKFLIHEELICAQSEFFDKCLKSGMQESLKKDVKLPEDDPDAFGSIVDWLYAQRIRGADSLNVDTLCHLLKIYVLADKLSMEWLCTKSCSTIDASFSNVPTSRFPLPAEALTLLVKLNLPYDSDLREIMVARLAKDTAETQTYVDTTTSAMKPDYLSFWKEGGDLLADAMVEHAMVMREKTSNTPRKRTKRPRSVDPLDDEDVDLTCVRTARQSDDCGPQWHFGLVMGLAWAGPT